MAPVRAPHNAGRGTCMPPWQVWRRHSHGSQQQRQVRPGNAHAACLLQVGQLRAGPTLGASTCSLCLVSQALLPSSQASLADAHHSEALSSFYTCKSLKAWRLGPCTGRFLGLTMVGLVDIQIAACSARPGLFVHLQANGHWRQ